MWFTTSTALWFFYLTITSERRGLSRSYKMQRLTTNSFLFFFCLTSRYLLPSLYVTLNVWSRSLKVILQQIKCCNWLQTSVNPAFWCWCLSAANKILQLPPSWYPCPSSHIRLHSSSFFVAIRASVNSLSAPTAWPDEWFQSSPSIGCVPTILIFFL